MLIGINSLTGRKAAATDGEIGTVYDFFFDDEEWGVRYVVIDTGRWLPSRKILLAIESIQVPESPEDAVSVNHSKGEIEKSPEINLVTPVTAEEEELIREYYGAWPHWAPYFVGAGPHKLTDLKEKAVKDFKGTEHAPRYVLHSVVELDEFRIWWSDDALDHVVDLMVDTSTWAIEKIVFRHSLFGKDKQHGVAPSELKRFDRETFTFYVDMTRDQARPIGELVSKD